MSEDNRIPEDRQPYSDMANNFAPLPNTASVPVPYMEHNQLKPTPPPIILTDEQSQAVDLILQWMADPLRKEFKLGGYAGTGKTTLMKFVLAELRKKWVARVCAFTGKAVSVLERKGISAQTMHSLMYDVVENADHTISFVKKYRLEAKPNIVIVDEASMINYELYNDLKSYGIKLLFVGDPGQLEPVGDNPNLMSKPDFVLSRIHRQAESSPIITLANKVRQGGSLLLQQSQDLVVMKKSLTPQMTSDYAQIICAKNKTRTSLNQKIRLNRALPIGQIVVGEKIIVLRNNPNFGVFNGMILFVDEVKEERATYWECACRDEIGKKFASLPIWKTSYEREVGKDERIPKDYVYTDYAYAITCHKSQGSEWESVLVVHEWMPPTIWDMKRWSYTAITRAAKKLMYQI